MCHINLSWTNNQTVCLLTYIILSASRLVLEWYIVHVYRLRFEDCLIYVAGSYIEFIGLSIIWNVRVFNSNLIQVKLTARQLRIELTPEIYLCWRGRYFLICNRVPFLHLHEQSSIVTGMYCRSCVRHAYRQCIVDSEYPIVKHTHHQWYESLWSRYKTIDIYTIWHQLQMRTEAF